MTQTIFWKSVFKVYFECFVWPIPTYSNEVGEVLMNYTRASHRSDRDVLASLLGSFYPFIQSSNTVYIEIMEKVELVLDAPLFSSHLVRQHFVDPLGTCNTRC